MAILFRSEVDEARRELVPYIVVDMITGEILDVNKSFEDMLGYPVRNELVGTNVDLLVPEPVRRAHAEHRAEFAENPQVRPMGKGIILNGRHKSGKDIPLVIALYPVVLSGRKCVVAIATDMSNSNIGR